MGAARDNVDPMSKIDMVEVRKGELLLFMFRQTFLLLDWPFLWMILSRISGLTKETEPSSPMRNLKT